MEQAIMKLCIVVVPSADGDRLLERLTENEFGATKIGSTGGFLKRGSTTVFIALEDHRVSDLTSLVREHFPEVTETVPVSALPLAEEWGLPTDLVDVRVGGAVMFVLSLDKFLRV